MTEYSEDALVERSAINVFTKDLKIEHLNCYEERFPETLGRGTKAEVVLIKRLSAAIDKLNHGLPEDAKKDAIEQLLQDRSRLSLVAANQEVHKLIKEGVKVKFKNKKGDYESETVRIIDFEEPENNDFFLASQFWVTGEIYPRRPDLVLFVNGLPLVVIELKARGVDVKRAFDDNITDYKDTIPQLFWYNAFILISNGRDAKIGTITSGYEHFSDWKRVESERETGIVSLDKILKGTCEKSRLIDIFENFILFTTLEGKQIKIVAKNHQYLGVKNAIEAFANRKKNKGRLGVFWHTPGAGKSYSMIFFSQKVLRKFEGNYTFVIVTDRRELDKQIYKNFHNAGVVTEGRVQAEDGEHLKMLLKEDHRLVFTLIHKFGTEKGETYPKLSDRDDIIVMTDEAHRTQYDTLALNMRNAVPNASFLAFTGTPLMTKGEEKTKDTFGDYVSVYNFRESIIDKATVPLYYENRVPELHLINPDLNEDIYNVIDEADLDESQEEKLSKEFSKEYHVITREDRLNTVAEDIAKHFINRGYEGKAMIVSIDKLTAVKMYDKVQYYWQKYIDNLQANLKKAEYGKAKELKDKIAELKKVDMAVVISPEQNEVKKFKDEGLDITKHRKRMVSEDLEKAFKDSNTDFKIVFVCSMWMTGFDVPCLSTIYLDKPMKNHTLMQAIARANRVFGEKPAGFIVDYLNIFRDLKKALSVYAASTSGAEDLPIQSKDKLVEFLRDHMVDLKQFLKEQKVDYEKIVSIKGLDKHALLDKALSALVINDEVKNNFLQKAGVTIKVYRAILPHKDASEFTAYFDLCRDLIKEIRSLDPEVDISAVMHDIQTVLDKSIASKGYAIKERREKAIDLSRINFEALQKQFEKKKSNADIERLKNIISFKLKEMIRLNSMRTDFQEKFQKLINDYNLGSLNNETFFKELVKFSKGLNEEEKRKVREGLSEGELALFDKLMKPDLTEAEKSKIKKIAKELLHKLQNDGLSAVDWRKKQQIRASIQLEIQIELEKLKQVYKPEELTLKSELLFQHFFDNYFGEGHSTYGLVG